MPIGGFSATFSAWFFVCLFFLPRSISPKPREDPVLMSWNVTRGRRARMHRSISSLESHEEHVHPPRSSEMGGDSELSTRNVQAMTQKKDLDLWQSLLA